MKTNPLARPILKFRVVLVCLAIIAIAELEVRIGDSLAPRTSQSHANTPGHPELSNMDISDVLGAVR